jgi:signal transduction histidine kinase
VNEDRNQRGSQTRRLLLIGFGGLLLLLAFTSLNTLSVLNKIQSHNEEIRRDYVNRDWILEQLRSDIYQSGTHVRDFLLDPDPAGADVHRREFEDARERIRSMEAAYERILRSEERQAFPQFTKELAAYFELLHPALQWDAQQRRLMGYRFMEESLLPRRQVVVRLADQISQVNRRQMEAGNQQMADLFDSFRRSLAVLLTITLLGGLLLAGGSVYRVLRLERLSDRRFEEILQARSDLRELSARVLEVQESERRALSRELHDEVGQSLSALLLGIGNVAAALPPDTNPELREELQDLRQLGEKTVAVVRDMSLLLRPSMLDDLGLVPALQWQAREVSRRNNLPVQISAESIPEELPDEHKTCIYRVVQEALHNVTRHGHAKAVQIHLAQRDGGLQLTIRDDGQGFEPASERGIGLLGMEERVTHLGGSFRVVSRPGEGALISVSLPFMQRGAS